MMWFSNGAPWLGWLCAVGVLGILTAVSPILAEDPTPLGPTALDPTPLGPAPLGHESTVMTARELVLEYAKAHGLQLYREASSDLDRDGLPDFVAHVGAAIARGPNARSPHARHENALIVAVSDSPNEKQPAPRIAAIVPDGMLCPNCPVGTQDGELVVPEQKLAASQGTIEICESWGTTWKTSKCEDVRLADDGSLRVGGLHESTTWTPGPSAHESAVDFVSKRGQRTYSARPLEPGFPRLERKVEFAIIAATRTQGEMVLDGAVNDAGWQGSTASRFESRSDLTEGEGGWSGTQDLAFSLRAAWSAESLYLAIAVEDDQLVEAGSADEKALMQADHVEIWLDRAQSMRVVGNAPETEEHRRVYGEDPVRHTPDEDLFDFAVGLADGTTSTALFLPRVSEDTEAERDTGGLQASVRARPGGRGYDVEVRVPAALFGVESLDDFDGRWLGAGLSVAVHDVDAGLDAPLDGTVMATSSLRWGDPFSVGLLLMPKRAEKLPVFPFVWSDWIDG